MICPISNYVTLPTLPLELLLIILGLLDDEDLYSLALLNRRLHNLALPIYIKSVLITSSQLRVYSLNFTKSSRQPGAFNYGCLILTGPPFRMLRAIRIAIFVQYLSSISMAISRQPVLPGVKELEHLIRKMVYVKRLSLDYGYFGRLKEQEGVREGLERLFDALACSECNALTLKGLNIGPEVSDVPHDVHLMTSLQTFEIYNSDIFCPPLQQYLSLSLNSSPLHTMNLHDVVCSQGTSSVGSMLPLLTLPALSYLYIFSRDLLFEDIMPFLSRHDNLVSLTLKCDSQVPPKSRSLSASALPRLSSLHATPQYVRYLLRPKGCFPKLRNIVINPDFPFAAQASLIESRFIDVEDSLASLSCHESISDLGLFLPSKSGAAQWLDTGSNPRRGKRRNVEKTLNNITAMNLESSGYLAFDPNMTPLVLKWVGLFPALRHVAFNACLPAMSTEEEIKFVRSIGEVCPTMESVQVGLQAVPRVVADCRRVNSGH